MSLHQIFTAQNLFKAEEKQAIAEAITEVYHILPAFYVTVAFIELDRDSLFRGGKSDDRFVRVSSIHLARSTDDVPPERIAQVMIALTTTTKCWK